MKSRTAVGRITFACLGMGAFSLSGCGDAESQHPKVVVLGFDGMDPVLCERLMDAGRMPNLASMRDRGGYRRLGTSIPPQSPVACCR